MSWIGQFLDLGLSIFLLMMFIVACWYLGDNSPNAPADKRWRRGEVGRIFALAPAFALLCVAGAMLDSLWQQPFVFERWLVAMSFLVLGGGFNLYALNISLRPAIHSSQPQNQL